MNVLAASIVALPFLVSLLVTPIYFPRFTLAATVPILLLVARGVRELVFPSLKVVALVVLVGSSLLLTVTYYQGTTEEPWERAATVAETNTGDGDLILLYPRYTGDFFPYYYDGSATVRETSGPADLTNESGDLQPRLHDYGRICLHAYTRNATEIATSFGMPSSSGSLPSNRELSPYSVSSRPTPPQVPVDSTHPEIAVGTRPVTMCWSYESPRLLYDESNIYMVNWK